MCRQFVQRKSGNNQHQFTINTLLQHGMGYPQRFVLFTFEFTL